jgi:hypothetical protein
MDLEWLDDETALPSVLLTELDEHTRALFEQICAFNCGMPIVRFLVENEHTLVTVEGIAFHLNEPLAKVAGDIYALAELGLARRVDVADLVLFGATRDTSRGQLMRDLCAWQERWHKRFARIQRAIGGTAARDENRAIYANR